MRLGILSFGERSLGETALTEALRAAEIDVILADEPVASFATARDEASRLARADCDGVVFYVAPTAPATNVGVSALHLAGVPILLSSPHPPSGLDAAGALAELGVSFDRHLGRALDAETVVPWLRQNSGKERQRGQAAAKKLYGQRLAVGEANTIGVDAARWMHQFGVIVLSGSVEDADFAALDGDVYGALTRQIMMLSHPVADTPVHDVTIGAIAQNWVVGDMAVTLARIVPLAGRHRCFLLTGTLRDRQFASDCSIPVLLGSLLHRRMHAIAGEHIGALRAACDALDIEAIVIQ